MKQVRIVHVQDFSEELYWSHVIFNRTYNRELFIETLGFPRCDLVVEEQRGALLHREVEVTPPSGNLPGPLQKLVGAQAAYREVGDFDAARRHYAIHVITALGERLEIRGAVTTRALSPQSHERVFECTVECKIFGVGGLLEKQVASDMESNWNRAAPFTASWVRKQGLV